MVGYCTVSSCSFEGTLKQHVKAGKASTLINGILEEICFHLRKSAVTFESRSQVYILSPGQPKVNGRSQLRLHSLLNTFDKKTMSQIFVKCI